MLKVLKKSFTKRKRHLHKNLEFLLDKFSLDISSLSAETKVPIATVFRMKKEDNNPTLSSVEPIADFFRVDLNDFLYEDMSSDEYQSKMSVGSIQYVPVVNLEDAKKWPIETNSKLYMGTVGNLHEGSFGINIDTDSMLPIFYKNSVLVIDPKIKPKDGDYVFCTLDNDKAPVLRQLFIDGNNYFFKPINPNYGDMICIKNYKIIGVIVKSIENYR